ncbi:MAG: hypothetical protein GXP43_03710 [bacterium]|nr:hypothetical protein [bacterium]
MKLPWKSTNKNQTRRLRTSTIFNRPKASRRPFRKALFAPFAFSLKKLLLVLTTAGLLLFAFVSLLNFTRLKTITCTNNDISPKTKQSIEGILTQLFINKPLILITFPQIKQAFKPLYIFQPTQIHKKYPSAILINCQPLNNKAYIHQINPPFYPRSLQDWLKLGYKLNSQKTNRLFLALFQPDQKKLSLLPIDSATAAANYHFYLTSISQPTLQNTWALFFWLKTKNPKPRQPYNIFITPVSALVFDPQKQLFYLLNPKSLPQPNSLDQIPAAADLEKPAKIIDWRFNHISVF